MMRRSANQTLKQIKKIDKLILKVMLLSVTFAVAIICGASFASAITPSDLPECAIECYIKGVSDVGIALDDYEGQCRSAPFQLSMKACAAMNCESDEFLFVCEIRIMINYRLRRLLTNIAWRTLV